MLSRSASIVGRACRLPGAASVDAFWNVLAEGRCTLSPIHSERWSSRRFWHPRRPVAGKTYAPNAGFLDNVFAFDPSVFGISPREAEQMDPQQRLSLELVWEALEDAGIPPASLAGGETGVFVGASALDYGNRIAQDTAQIDSYFATGNTLSIISNRISYVLDLRGPSFTIDTACSSALFALNEAVEAIESGRVDTAIVVGVNILLSPYPFLGFAQANMLSQRGVCSAFDADADGYVRAEGGVALVLRRSDIAERAHAVIAASGTNQDGRTIGMSLPSSASQEALLRRVYAGLGNSVDDLAFVEAHGTGTRVGDPAEANAVGRVLAQPRSRPLPIGSAKSNVGHLEPASGLVGVLKAMLALEHDLLPASLHIRELNPDIAFDELNLAVARDAVRLAPQGARRRYAGINSFGFGGANAHVVIADPERPTEQASEQTGPRALVLSAATREALQALASNYRDRLATAGDAEAAIIASAASHRRAHMAQRLVVDGTDARIMREGLSAFADGRRDPRAISGNASASGRGVAFVYSGNGAQWAGMGRRLLADNSAFAARFDEIDATFSKLAGWSLREAIAREDLETELRRAEIVQPILFAIQSSTTAALRAEGLKPDLAFGHSVGEVAAAEAAGALSLEDAVRVIHARSVHQERARGLGTMAAIRIPPEEAAELLADPRHRDLELAAVNSPRSVTISGSDEDIRALAALGRERRIAVRPLDLDYPFHHRLIDSVRAPLVEALRSIAPGKSAIPFISSVDAAVVSGDTLDADYWWRNVREPVRFADTVGVACAEGAGVFVEISPKMILGGYLRETLAEAGVTGLALACSEHDTKAPADPVRSAVAQAFAGGAAIDLVRFAGADTGARIALPTYPWQRQDYVVHTNGEGTDVLGLGDDHPLIGGQLRHESGNWLFDLDIETAGGLADHVVGGMVVMPAAALIEMALAAGIRQFGETATELRDFEILHALTLEPDAARTIEMRIAHDSRVVDIRSRPRNGGDNWTTHARGRLASFAGDPPSPMASVAGDDVRDVAAIYETVAAHGLLYGPAFRLLKSLVVADDAITATITPAPREGHTIAPAELDAAFQSLVALAAGNAGGTYLPARFGEVRTHLPQEPVVEARCRVRRRGARSIEADFDLLSDRGAVVATIRGARFRAAALGRIFKPDQVSYRTDFEILDCVDAPAAPVRPEHLRDIALQFGMTAERPAIGEAALLLDAFAAAASEAAIAPLLDRKRRLDPERLLASGRFDEERALLVERLASTLETQRLAVADERSWVLPRHRRPGASAILAAMLSDSPDRTAEAAMGARAAAALRDAVAGTPAPERLYSAATRAHHAIASPDARARIGAVDGLVGEIIADWPAHRPLRIVELGAGAGGLTERLAARLGDARITLVVTDPDPAVVERLSVTFGGRSAVRFEAFGLSGESELPTHDIAVCAGGLSRLVAAPGAEEQLLLALSPGARLIASEERPSAFADLVHGFEPGWFARSATPDFAFSPLRSSSEWRGDLEQAGFGEVHADPLADAGDGSLILACVPPRVKSAPERAAQRAITLIGSSTAHEGQAALLASALAAESVDVQLLDAPSDAAVLADREIVHLAGGRAGETDADALTAWVDELRELLPAAAQSGSRLWIVAPGALDLDGGPVDPVSAGVAGFARVAANEFKTLDIRLLSPSPALDPVRQASALAMEILHPRADSELAITAHDVRAPRIRLGRRKPAALDGALFNRRLDFGATAGLDELAWTISELPEPGPGEIAIDVAAAGLNFRDVMWSMGLLPEEALEDGFAGATLGLEAAGTVAAIGAGVKDLAVGDRVAAFVAGGFASRLVTPRESAVKLPDAIPTDAAAGIPVAFLTAYYALIELGRIERGQSVLIHGGAGGVGLAALQIAKLRSATVFATAGTPEKRDLLRALGADHVLNSRDLRFVEEIRAITDGAGVDIVLNSLSGEAMEQSLGLVKPFGRFLELGKRDYYANSRIGLRPFRRNVSYFGIDADQLFAGQPRLAQRLFSRLMRLFERGQLTPVPYRRFEADHAIDAFRLMQQSGHIGKIVIAPPAAAPAAGKTGAFSVRGDGTYLVVGGLSGFGLATAQWLVERGARHLVLIGRRGAIPEAQPALDAMQAQGANVLAAACDVTDEARLAALLDQVRATMPPIRGVIHAAMVLDDALLINLDRARLATVIAPKVAGADNLDRLTRTDPLDHFVLYSSATTLVGNPGQANYVAANAYLEGLARRRRAEGLPALAIGWGALLDVGYLTRDEDTREKLARRIGAHALTGREALEALGRLLAAPGADAVIVVAPLEWAAAKRELAVLDQPPFREILHDVETGVIESGDQIELGALLAGHTAREQREIVCGLLATEVARILKLPVQDIDPQRPLPQIGMDSLTALELRLNVERRLGIELPLVAMSEETTLASIAAGVVSRFDEPDAQASPGGMSADLIRRHASGSEGAGDLAELAEDAEKQLSTMGRVLG